MCLIDNMPDECSIAIRRQKLDDPIGGEASIVDIQRSGVQCWVQQASASEVSEYDKRGISISHKIFFPADPGVNEGYLIKATKRSGVVVSGQWFDVVSYTDPDASAGLGVVWKLMVNRTTGED